MLEVDTCQAKNVSEISRESDEESKVYDFNDEQVGNYSFYFTFFIDFNFVFDSDE